VTEAAAAVLALCVVGAVAPGAAARTLCVVSASPVEGVDPEVLETAIAVEALKAGIALERARASTSARCDASEVLVLDGLVVRLRAGREDAVWRPSELDPSELDPSDPATDLARRVVAALVAVRPGDVLVDSGIRRDSGPAGPVIAPPIGASPEGFVSAGGRWEHQPRPGVHLAGADVAIGLALFRERLAMGVRLGWLGGSGPGGLGVSGIQAVPVTLWVWGGPSAGPFLFRAGGGVGLEWRRVLFGAGVMSVEGGATDVVPTLEGEVEASLLVPRGFRVALAGGVRGFLAGEAQSLGGRQVYDPPRWSGGLAARLSYAFGGGAHR